MNPRRVCLIVCCLLLAVAAPVYVLAGSLAVTNGNFEAGSSLTGWIKDFGGAEQSATYWQESGSETPTTPYGSPNNPQHQVT